MSTPQTTSELGLMAGTPPVGDALVTLANWQDPPFNRWGFQHLRELIPTARIRPADRPWDLPREESDLAGMTVTAHDRDRVLGELLEDTYTDGFLVFHRGR